MDKVVGISGSTVRNSTTDGLIKVAMEATGMVPSFIKLIDHKIAPCRNCTVRHPDFGYIIPCQIDNECFINDDFGDIVIKLREADAIIVGTNPTWGGINAVTKLFFERCLSLTHAVASKNPPSPLAGKLAAVICVCNSPSEGETSAQYTEKLFKELSLQCVGELVVQGSYMCQFVYECALNRRATIGGRPETVFVEPFDKELCTIRETLKDEAILEKTRRMGLKIKESHRQKTKQKFPLISKLPAGWKLEDGGDRFGTTPVSMAC